MFDYSEHGRVSMVVKQMLAQHQEGIMCLCRVAGDFFAELADAKQYRRHPNLGVRLYQRSRDYPILFVALYPGWDAREKKVQPHNVHLDVCEIADVYGHKRIHHTLAQKGDRLDWSRMNITHGERAMQALIAIVADALDDPALTFASSSDNCCMCGKPLVDPQSRSRGIGPDCIRKYTSFCSLVAKHRAGKVEPQELFSSVS